MKIREAQEYVDKKLMEYGGYWSPLSQFARLVEEVGELGRAINIKHGEKKAKKGDEKGSIQEEISDVFFTILAIANNEKINLQEEFTKKIEKDHQKVKETYNDNTNTQP